MGLIDSVFGEVDNPYFLSSLWVLIGDTDLELIVVGSGVNQARHHKHKDGTGLDKEHGKVIAQNRRVLIVGLHTPLWFKHFRHLHNPKQLIQQIIKLLKSLLVTSNEMHLVVVSDEKQLVLEVGQVRFGGGDGGEIGDGLSLELFVVVSMGLLVGSMEDVAEGVDGGFADSVGLVVQQGASTDIAHDITHGDILINSQ